MKLQKPSTRIRVALVEDDDSVREGLEILIARSPICQGVGAYPTAEKFLADIQKLQVDVLLLDIGLPGISGIECVTRINALGQSIQIMMLTVFDQDDKIFESLEAGASAYLLKQTPPAKLLEAIQELHNGGSPMSPTIARKVIATFQKPVRRLANPLTPRETQILEALAKGLLYKEIGDQLRVSIETVRTHLHNIYQKLHVRNRTEAVIEYKKISR